MPDAYWTSRDRQRTSIGPIEVAPHRRRPSLGPRSGSVTQEDLERLLAEVHSPLVVLKWLESRCTSAEDLKELSSYVEHVYWNENHGFMLGTLVRQLTDAWRPEFDVEGLRYVCGHP